MGKTRRLVEVLNTSDDPTVLSVAANDIAKFVKFYEPGKKSVAFFPFENCLGESLINPFSKDCVGYGCQRTAFGAFESPCWRRQIQGLGRRPATYLPAVGIGCASIQSIQVPGLATNGFLVIEVASFAMYYTLMLSIGHAQST
jgi:hypothetical protein